VNVHLFFWEEVQYLFFGEKCGCKNVSHKQDNYYYTFETIIIANNSTEVQENEKRSNEQEKK